MLYANLHQAAGTNSKLNLKCVLYSITVVKLRKLKAKNAMLRFRLMKSDYNVYLLGPIQTGHDLTSWNDLYYIVYAVVRDKLVVEPSH